MRERHSGKRTPIRLRWLAGALVAAVAGSVAFAVTSPAGADATTVKAQLSLSGVATKADVLGGSTVGVHPGDTVDFQASALPTAGLDNIPALGTLLDSLLSKLTSTSFQVVVTFGADFPGGAQTVTLGGPTSGKCAGKPDLPVTFPKAGTYNFSWTVQYVLPNLLGCAKNGLSSTQLNQLSAAGVKLNASNQWVGQVKVGDNVGGGGISVQLPGVSVAPSVPVLGQLPTVGISNINLPTIPVTLPSLGGLGGNGGNSGGRGSTGSSGPPDSPHPNGGLPTEPIQIPALVVPHPNATGGGGIAGIPLLPDGGQPTVAPTPGATGTVLPTIADTSPVAAAANSGSTQRLLHQGRNQASSTKLDGAQLPIVLTILAIIALVGVTAAYGRLRFARAGGLTGKRAGKQTGKHGH